MPRILLIKTSSLGDVVHNLPVVADIRRAIPESRIDWVVEEAFAAIPGLHPHVERVIPVAVRRWRRHPLDARTRQEFGNLRRLLREPRYDTVIDTQGLIKSALFAFMASGERHGLDWRSSREPLRLFYDRVHAIPWSLHAVERNRLLAARALGYIPSGAPDWAIAPRAGDLATLDLAFPQRESLAGPYVMFLHATSAAAKEWPEQNWVALGKRIAERGFCCILPFGSAVEQARSARLARQIPRALAPTALGLGAVAALLAGAHFVVGVDTGLSHLSAALGKPTVGLYCATDPAATGLYGSTRAVNLGGIARMPDVEKVVAAIEQVTESA